MSVKLEITIEECDECPYLKYDGDYGLSYDSGYDCGKSYMRIVNDWELKQFEKETKEWWESQKTLFPLPKSQKPKSPWKIPKECPLR